MKTRCTQRNTWEWSLRAISGRTSSSFASGGNGMLLHQAAGLSSSATTWITRSEHLMMLEHSMWWAFRTLDGAGTFHGMGIQNTGWCWNIPWDGHYPGTKHRREVTATLETVSCTMGKVFICCFDASVVDLSLAYQAVLQNFTAEDKSKILYTPWKVSSPLSRLVSDDAECVWRDMSWSEYFPFLPMIDMDPTNMSCIFLHSGTTLWSHTSSYLESHDGHWQWATWLSHGPSSYRLGDFTQKWAFFAAWDDWRQDLAFNNCWKWSLLRILSHTCWLARPSSEQFEDSFLQMLFSNAEVDRARVTTKCKYWLIMWVFDAKPAECFLFLGSYCVKSWFCYHFTQSMF